MIAVADHPRTRFGQARILPSGHSRGACPGIHVAAAPDRFFASAGPARIAHRLRSETPARDHRIGAFRGRGDARILRRLEAGPVRMAGGTPAPWTRLRDRAIRAARVGHMHKRRLAVAGIVLPALRGRPCTPPEKVTIRRGGIWSRPVFRADPLRDDLTDRLARLERLIHRFTVRHDGTARAGLGRACFDASEAPIKGVCPCERLAPGPPFDEPARTARIPLPGVPAAPPRRPTGADP